VNLNIRSLASLVIPLNILGFTQITKDELYVQPTLTSTLSRFLTENRDLIVADANAQFMWKDENAIGKAFTGIADSNDWTMNIFYVRILSIAYLFL
jgi:hypothetical protein